MAKDNAFYFTHDYNTRNDSKIKNLLSVHGFLGYGLFWAIIEDLYNNANELPLDYRLLAYDLRCDEKTIKSIINEFSLFVINENSFGSISVQRRLEDRSNKSLNAKTSVFKRWGELDKKPLSLDATNKNLRSQRLSLARSKGTHTKIEWQNMRLYFSECLKCGANDDIVKDHIIPIYQGGSDSIDNIQPLCRKCNASKGSKSINYKEMYFDKNDYETPTNWLKTPTIKEKKVKEIKKKENKENKTKDLILPEMVKIWFEWYEFNFKVKPKFSKVDGAKLKSIRTYLESVISAKQPLTDELLYDGFRIVLEYSLKHEFVSKNLSLAIIDMKMNEIIALTMKRTDKGSKQDDAMLEAKRISELKYNKDNGVRNLEQ
jgi:5-methylcytosine-specific restriction endonuclease McrA